MWMLRGTKRKRKHIFIAARCGDGEFVNAWVKTNGTNSSY